jgi:hypothetical protein
MGLKELLKPNKWKIILFFIIGALVLFLEFMNSCLGPGPDAGALACLGPISSFFYIIINPFFLLARVINGRELIYLFTTILFILLQIFYVYILSSLIVFIIGKIKSKE